MGWGLGLAGLLWRPTVLPSIVAEFTWALCYVYDIIVSTIYVYIYILFIISATQPQHSQPETLNIHRSKFKLQNPHFKIIKHQQLQLHVSTSEIQNSNNEYCHSPAKSCSGWRDALYQIKSRIDTRSDQISTQSASLLYTRWVAPSALETHGDR